MMGFSWRVLDIRSETLQARTCPWPFRTSFSGVKSYGDVVLRTDGGTTPCSVVQ